MDKIIEWIQNNIPLSLILSFTLFGGGITLFKIVPSRKKKNTVNIDKEKKYSSTQKIKSNNGIIIGNQTIINKINRINEIEKNDMSKDERTIEEKSIDCYEKGMLFFNNNEYNPAISEFSKAIEYNQKNIKAYYYRGKAVFHNFHMYKKMNKEIYLNNAIKDFKEVLKIDSSYAPSHLYLADIYSIKHKNSKIKRDIDGYKKLANDEYNWVSMLIDNNAYKKNDIDLEFADTNYLLKRKHYGKGKLNYESYMKETKNANYVNINLPDLEIAIDDFSKVIKIYNDDYYSHLYRGHLFYFCARIYIYGENKNIEKSNENFLLAKNDYTETIRLSPNIEVLYLYRAAVEKHLLFNQNDIETFLKMIPSKDDYIKFKINLKKEEYNIGIDADIDRIILRRYED